MSSLIYGGVTQNRVGKMSMRRRLPLNREDRWEGMGGRRGIAQKMEGDPHNYMKYIYDGARGKKRERNVSQGIG